MSTLRWIVLSVIVVASGLWLPAETVAQIRPNAFAGRSRYGGNVRQQLQRNPTVSPYLNLVFNGPTTNTLGSSVATYQTLVRPQMEARENAVLQQRQLDVLQRQVSDIRSTYQAGQNGQIATGHPTRYQIHSHYYPQLDVR